MSAPKEIREVAPGVWAVWIFGCTLQQADRILLPDPSTHVWLPGYAPHVSSSWDTMRLPLAADGEPRRIRARLVSFEAQFTYPEFLAALPEMHAWAGAAVLQLRRPVADNLLTARVLGRPNEYRILGQNGWLLSMHLSHDGDTAEVRTADRAHLERLLADPELRTRE